MHARTRALQRALSASGALVELLELDLDAGDHLHGQRGDVTWTRTGLLTQVDGSTPGSLGTEHGSHGSELFSSILILIAVKHKCS